MAVQLKLVEYLISVAVVLIYIFSWWTGMLQRCENIVADSRSSRRDFVLQLL